MRKRRKSHPGGSRLLGLRLSVALAGGLAGAAVGTGGEFVFHDLGFLCTCAGVVLALALLEAVLRLPSPFQSL